MKLRKAVFLTIVAASLAAAALVAFDSFDGSIDRNSRRVGRQQFQSLVRGLGLGSHTDLARCSWLFDPRVAGDDHAALGCLPGDPGGCNWHALSIFPVPRSDGDGPDYGAESDAVEKEARGLSPGVSRSFLDPQLSNLTFFSDNAARPTPLPAAAWDGRR